VPFVNCLNTFLVLRVPFGGASAAAGHSRTVTLCHARGARVTRCSHAAPIIEHAKRQEMIWAEHCRGLLHPFFLK